MPGAVWFPGVTTSYAEAMLRLPGRADDDVVVVSRSQARERAQLDRRAAARRGGPRARRAGAAGGRARRPRGGVRAEHRRDARAAAGGREPGRGVLLGAARVRHPERGRPARPGGAGGAGRGRRLRVRRAPRRPLGRAGGDPRGAAGPAPHRAPALPRPRRPGARGREHVGGAARRGGPAGLRAGGFRPPALRAVLQRHDGAAEADPARARRHRAAARRGAGALHRPGTERPVLLVLDHRLDDVELPRLRAAGRHDRGALRRQPRPPRPDGAVADGRGDRADVLRQLGAVPDGLPQGGLRPGAEAGPVAAARGRLHGRAAAAGGVPLGARGGVGRRRQIGSVSGGTDVCAAFAGPTPMLPVWEGEISGRLPGLAVEAWAERPGGDRGSRWWARSASWC